MNVPAALSHKIGPLPAGAWIVAVAGGIGVAVVIRRGATNTAAADEAYAAGEQAGYDSVAEGDAGAGGNGPGLGGAATSSPNNPGTITYYVPGVAPATNTTTPPPKPPKPRTNGAWRTYASEWLVKYKRYRHALVSTSFDRWFAGKTLTPVQQNVVNEAIAYLGPPPHPPRKHRPGVKRDELHPIASRKDTGLNTSPGRVIVP